MNRPWIAHGVVAAVLLTASMQAFSLSGGPLSGVVLDKESKQPMAGVIVVARWRGNWTKIFGESSSACYHVETARTDASGRYQIPSWTRAWSIEDLRFSPLATRFLSLSLAMSTSPRDRVGRAICSALWEATTTISGSFWTTTVALQRSRRERQ